MNVTLKYTAKNIAHNKLRVWMISLSTLISSLVFFFAFIFPTMVTVVQQEAMKTYYGSSDIYVIPDIAGLQELFSSDTDTSAVIGLTGKIQMRKLRQNTEVMDLLDYAVSTFAVPGNIDNNDAYIIFANLNDFDKFNPISYSTYDPQYITADGNLVEDTVVISKSYATEKQLNIGDKTSIFVPLCGEKECVVAVIAEDEGIFSPINKEFAILPKESAYFYLDKLGAGLIGAGITSNVEYFDLALIKVKDGVDIDYATEQVRNVFDGLSVNKTIDLDLIGETVDSVMPLFIIGAVITCLFCGFILYCISNTLVKDRTTEFARLRSMGARVPSLILSLLMENLFYAIIGSILGIGIATLAIYLALPAVLPAIKIVYFIYPILLSIALSFIGIALQFGLFFKSVKQSLVNSEKSSTIKKSLTTLIVLINIGSFVFALCAPRGWKTTSTIMYCLFAFTLIYLAPTYFQALCWVISKLFKVKNFPFMYIKNSTHTSHTPWLIRAITLGAITITLISTMNTTFQNSMAESNEHVGYDITVTGLIGHYTPTNFKNINGVDTIYPFTELQSVKVDSLTRNTTLYAFNDADTTALLSTYTDQATLNNLKLEGAILVGNYFRDVLGYEKGDVVKLNLNNTQKGTKDFVIVGFVDGEKYAKSIIADLHEINYLTDVRYCTNIYIKAKEGKVEDVIDLAKSRCLLIENSNRTSDKTSTMFSSIFGIIIMLVVAILAICVASNFMCFVIFLRQIRKNCFAFNTMGLSPSYLSSLLSLQLVSYALLGSVFSIFTLLPLLTQSANIMATCNLTMHIVINFGQIAIVLLTYCIIFVLLSWIFIPIMSKKLTQRQYSIIKLG